MLKKIVSLLGISLLLFSGCQANDPNARNIGMQGKGFTSIHQVDDIAHLRTDESKLVGFMEHTETDPDVVYSGYGAEYLLDRNILADSISKIVVGYPDVQAASVLVTEDSCIIGYQARENPQANVHDQMIKTGMSVTPRWYDIYATDDAQIIEQIRQLGLEYENGNINQRQLRDQVEQITQHVSRSTKQQKQAQQQEK